MVPGGGAGWAGERNPRCRRRRGGVQAVRHESNPSTSFIASGAFGAATFDHGLLSAAAGAGFHFVIAFVAAAVYVAGARILPLLQRHWVVAGLVYGAWVWVFMNLIVLPFTAVVPGPSSIWLTLNGVIGHALFVGLPIAYFARQI